MRFKERSRTYKAAILSWQPGNLKPKLRVIFVRTVNIQFVRLDLN